MLLVGDQFRQGMPMIVQLRQQLPDDVSFGWHGSFALDAEGVGLDFRNESKVRVERTSTVWTVRLSKQKLEPPGPGQSNDQPAVQQRYRLPNSESHDCCRLITRRYPVRSPCRFRARNGHRVPR